METQTKMLLTVAECEALTGVCKSKIYELIRANAWPSVRIGTAIRVPLAGIESLVNEALENVSR